MNFELDEELRQYRDSVIAFAQKELNDDVVTRDAEVAFSREGWRKCADFGIQGLPVPLKYGGQGASASTIIVAMEALGYGCRDAGLIFSMNAQMWGCTTPLLRAGSEEQKRRYLPALCRGSIIGAHAMTEPGSGSDAFALSTSATRSGDSYMLNGSKTFVSNAPVADLFVTFATIDRSLGFAGLCAFLVDRDAPGLVIGKPLAKMGLRTSPMSEVVFEGCRIPATALLGREGGGMALFATAMDWERSCILAGALGTMQRQLERSLDYARDRKQFGQPIGKFQA
ncbi:MAG: acyl-CoA dehydrogenase family protein, partial [bacterium]